MARLDHLRRVAGVVLVMMATGLAVSARPSAVMADVPLPPAPDTSTVVPVRSGDVSIVDVNKRAEQISNGGSATEFSLEPTAGAVCPGDSMNDSWRVQTFIVPGTVDPGTLAYGVVGPTGPHQYAVYDKFTAPVVDYLTISNSAPGQPARIDVLPPMSFAVFPPGEIPDGAYRIGVACTYFGKTANYWDTEIVIKASSDDKPAHLVWRLSTAPEIVDHGSGGVSPLIVVAIGLLIALVLGWLAWRRTDRSRSSRIRSVPPSARLSKESQ